MGRLAFTICWRHLHRPFLPATMAVAPVSGTVVLVHGIHSIGDWYPQATTGLTPHFIIRRARYDGYQTRGIGMLRTLITGRRYLRRAVLKVCKELGSAKDQRPVHILAHSWGTYVSLRSIRRERTDRYGQIVLVGTPMSRKLRWRQDDVHKRVASVENIMLSEDEIMVPLDRLTSTPWVGRGVGWMAFGPDIGGAGAGSFEAFSGDLHPDDVHTHQPLGADPKDWQCRSCSSGRAWLHNWKLVSTHSELLNRWDKFATVVRPLLWGITPGDYQQWLDDCNALKPWFDRAKGQELSAVANVFTVGAPGPKAMMVRFDRALANLLETPRHFFEGTLGALLSKESARYKRARAAPAAFIGEWALRIAEKSVLALIEDRKAWSAMEAALRDAPWEEPSEDEKPDPSDARFPAHPWRAFETVKRSIKEEIGPADT